MIWCQGFSEPEAGSDLASLRTTARRDGDGWLISGQKIWTSYATMAQWCFLLARTTKGEKKQQGLTIFLVPMNDPAIQVRPIRCMMGPHHLNEVFFDDLRVTEADVLGTVDDGWSIVQDVMSFERVGIARYARCERLLAAGARRCSASGGSDAARGTARPLDPDADALPTGPAAGLPGGRAAEQPAGSSPADAAAYRIAVTKLDQDSAEVLMEIAAEVPATTPTRRPGSAAEVEDHWRYSQASTVSSGSIEMQRILLSRALLAAGDDPRLSATTPANSAARRFAPSKPPAATSWCSRPRPSPPIGKRWSAPVLAELGAWDLDPRTDADSLEAAAALCRSAGLLGAALPGRRAAGPARPTSTSTV